MDCDNVRSLHETETLLNIEYIANVTNELRYRDEYVQLDCIKHVLICLITFELFYCNLMMESIVQHSSKVFRTIEEIYYAIVFNTLINTIYNTKGRYLTGPASVEMLVLY